MDDNLKQNNNDHDIDGSGASINKGKEVYESPRLNEIPVKDVTPVVSGNVSGSDAENITSDGVILKEDFSKGIDSKAKTPADVIEDLDEDFESYMDDSSL